jgi:glutamate-1-semialdehyde 2,1-aminomutase
MFRAAEAIEKGIAEVFDSHDCAGHVTRLGARIAYDPFSRRASSGRESLAAINDDADRLIHLYMLNRGVLLTPFQNMCLVAPQTGNDDINRHTNNLDNLLSELRN